MIFEKSSKQYAAKGGLPIQGPLEKIPTSRMGILVRLTDCECRSHADFGLGL